ncbi:hypothetical protein [Yoonia sp.]|uniref:hypothetical protein n=1 Tax=Yoonia sp. TaxID=2212373 RepID=UPI0023B6F687
MEPVAAIEEATRNRIRPIFMSPLKSVIGMFPDVGFPGKGSGFIAALALSSWVGCRCPRF